MYWQGCWLCLYLFMRGDLVNRERIKKFVGGQAVIEGVMMRHKDTYAVAVRKPDGEIEVETEEFEGVLHHNKIKTVPFIRGVFNFLDSLIL